MEATGPVPAAGPARPGRPPSTTRLQVELAAFRLFAVQGFEATTVEDIARASGISRRTFFRYYASKNDIVWGDFAGELRRMQRWLADADPARPLRDTLVAGILAFNVPPAPLQEQHRQRMTLILGVPALQAHSTLLHAAWRGVVAEHVGRRLGRPAQDLVPQVFGHALLGAAVAAYERWLSPAAPPLAEVLREALEYVLDGLASAARGGPAAP